MKKPIIIFDNLKKNKSFILSTHKNKSGIYRFINKLNNKSYIGSSSNLRTRFRVYFSKTCLMKSKMAIYKALIKYGHENFKLEILEYCDKSILMNREQYYLDNYKPEYNILNKAYSSLNFKHKIETLEKFKNRVFSDETKLKIALSAKNRIISQDIRNKISVAHKGKILSDITKNKISKSTISRIGKPIKIINIKTNKEYLYPSLTDGAKAINISRTAIAKALSLKKMIKKIYIIKYI